MPASVKTMDNSLRLRDIYNSNELESEVTAEDFSVVRQKGARQVESQTEHYKLDKAGD